MAEIKLIAFKFIKGMQQDLDLLSIPEGTAYRLYNIKTQSVEDTILNSLTNEKGTIDVSTIIKTDIEDDELHEYHWNTVDYIQGNIIGVIQCTDKEVTVFTTEEVFGTHVDRVIKLIYAGEENREIRGYILAEGNFNFDVNHEISGLFVYENSELLKVYWVDGINLLRFLNVATPDDEDDDLTIKLIFDANYLEASPAFKVDHHFEAKRVVGTGLFPAGVILYCFTYYNKYGAETNIVDMTPLYYISEDDRGLEADQYKNCAFEVTLTNPDTSFDYARVYSIIRSAYNGEPVVKIVGDIKLK